jgi:MFS transporter, MHS family, alpha-ketoglutarate permease
MSDSGSSSAALSWTESNGKSISRTVAGGMIGNIIEWYDWTIYGLLSSVFAGQFFPSGNATTSLLATLATFALGFVMRPVGSVVLSPLADRYGRRRMLSLTILLMGAGSLIVAITPSYAVIGIAAPLLLLFARLLQGFSAGGEFQGAATFLVEHAPADRRGFIGSLHIASIGFSILIATGVSALLTKFVAQPTLGDWGWRVPFLLGAAVSLYGLYIRIGLPETPSFVAAEQRRALEGRPILRALMDHPWESFVVFAMQMGTVQFYIWTIFLPTYAYLAGGLPLSEGFIGGVISLAVFCVATPTAGAVSDRIGRRPVLIAYAIGFFVLAWPMLHLLQNGDFTTFLLVDIIGCLLLAMVDGVMSATFCELFPTQVRVSGIGLPYAVCAAIFSGTAPLIAAWLLSRQIPWLLAVYIMTISAIGGVTFLKMRETRGIPLD